MEVLLIEDEKNIASFIERGLEEAGFSVRSAYDGETGLAFLEDSPFDIVILDVILPQMDGWEVCRKIRQDFRRNIPILMLSALNQTEQVVRGLDAGADDYLGKPFKMTELVARLHALGRRYRNHATPPVESNSIAVADLQMDLEAMEVWRGDARIKLTVREFRLLHFFLKNVNKVVTRFQLLDQVWGMDFDTGTNVVDVYVNYLRNKIDKDFPVRLIHTVYGVGYILKDDHAATE